MTELKQKTEAKASFFVLKFVLGFSLNLALTLLFTEETGINHLKDES